LEAFMTGGLSVRPLVAAGMLALTSVAALAQGPDSVADIAAPLLDAVVNVSTSQNVSGARDPGFSPEGDGSVPFEQYFNDFLGNPDQPPPDRPQRVQSLGSGFVIDPKGIIITNNHVIEDADEITVNFNDGTKLSAKVLGRDDKTDLAVLSVTPDAPLTSVKFGDSDTIRVGDWVMAIGNPFGLGGTLTVGIVSARNRVINAGPYDDFIQTDAAINRGNSGGPLFNMAGEVIGINTAIISPTGGSIGLGFSIPSDAAMKVIDQLVEFGETRRGWLGVHIKPVTEDVAKDLGLAKPRGALVGSVDAGGPAAAAGILAGDVIVSMDGKAVDMAHPLQRLVADEPDGKAVAVTVVRDGKEQAITVTLGRLEAAEKASQAKPTPDAQPAPPDAGDQGQAVPGEMQAPFGLRLAELTPDVRKTFAIGEEVKKGVVVTAVEPGSPADEARLKAGDTISMVGKEAVETPDQFSARIDSLRSEGRANAQVVIQDSKGVVRFSNITMSK
jgi:serine protease Do